MCIITQEETTEIETGKLKTFQTQFTPVHSVVID